MALTGLKTGLTAAVHATGEAVGLAGKTARESVRVGEQGMMTATRATGQALNTTGDVAVSSMDAAGRTTAAATDTAAASAEFGAAAVKGTASALIHTATTMNQVAAAKGRAMAKASIAADEAKSNAFSAPENVAKQDEVAIQRLNLKLTKAEYDNELDRLRAKSRNLNETLRYETRALRSEAAAGKKLNSEQAIALIASARARRKLMRAEDAAKRIEQEVNMKRECRLVFQELGERERALDDYPDLSDQVSQEKFCDTRIECRKTGRVRNAFGINRRNPETCREIQRRYSDLKRSYDSTTESNIASNMGGGKKKRTRKKKSATKKHKTKRHKTQRHKTKRRKTKRHKTKRRKTKRNTN